MLHSANFTEVLLSHACFVQYFLEPKETMAVNCVFLVSMLTASLCISFTRANNTTNQNTTGGHSVCDSFCTIEDLSAVAQLFEKQTTVEKARVVYFTLYTKGLFCVQDIGYASAWLWAVDEKEPSMYLPSDFLHFSNILRPYLRQQLNIHLDCTAKTRTATLHESGTSLHDAFVATLMQNLVRTSGALCSRLMKPQRAELYTCCELDVPTSEKKCSVVEYSGIAGWLWMLYILLFITSIGILPFYLPGIICFFPSPKVSEDGISCLELGDPSPAGFRCFLVKVFVPQTNNSLLDKTRVLLLRIIFIPSLAVLPLLLGSATLISITSITSGTSVQFSSSFFIMCCCAYVVQSLFAALDLPTPPKPCKFCNIVFSEPVVHHTTADEIRAHLKLQLYVPLTRCRLFSCCYLRQVKTLLRRCLKAPMVSVLYPLQLLTVVVVFFLALLGLVVGNVFFFLFYFSRGCPLDNFDLCGTRLGYLRRIFERHITGKISSFVLKWIEVLVRTLSAYAVGYVVYGASIESGIMLFYTIMTIIDDADVLFPYLGLSVLILYYLCSCFRSFSEYYQQLKINLYQGCKKYQESKKSEEGCTSQGKLILYTRNKAVAIPKDLYETACKELHMPVMQNLWLAVLKAAGFLIFVLFVFASIMVFGARSGIAPLTQTVAMFIAGFFPKLFVLFSSGMTLKEDLELEGQLEDIICNYVQRQAMADREEETTFVEMDSTEGRAINMAVFVNNTNDTTIERMDTAVVQE